MAYDAIQSDNSPTDRKLIVDIAVLRQPLEEPGAGFTRWVPGKEIPSDGLTKWHGNSALERLMAEGHWSLCDTPEAETLRRKAALRKRQCKQGSKAGMCRKEHDHT